MNLKNISSWENLIKKNERVLDVGCWSGNRIKKLRNKCEIYGIDINTKRFEGASSEIRKRLFFGDITKQIGEKKPFNKKFDWIFLGEVLEHIKKDDVALQNINKILKKRGKLIITTPKSIPFFEFWDPAWIRWKMGLGERHYHYKKEELIQKLKKKGFKIKEIRAIGNLKWLLNRWINIILKYIFNSRKLLKAEKKYGFFDWEILAEKIK